MRLFEIFHIIYEENGKYFNDSVKAKSLIEDLKQVRLSKITNRIHKLEHNSQFAQMNNITTYEINVIRPLLIGAFDIKESIGNQNNK